MKLNPIARNLMVISVSAAAVGACAKAEIPLLHSVSTTRESAARIASAQPPSPVGLFDFSSLVDKFGPAVVNISVTGPTKAGTGMLSPPSLDPRDPLWQFFRRFQMPSPPQETPASGLGSGFIVSPDGVILTNAHVIDGATDVTVRLTDGREFKAKVIGADKHSDVAVIKIGASDLPTVKLGNSADLRVGQWVVAIGSPYGFDNTVTSGIISAKARSLGSDTYVPYLQTNAVINPGSSGGPLFDLQGDVIGINSQIYSRSGGYQGLSFAIPIEVAVKVKDDLVRYGHVTHGRLGVTVQPVTQALAESFGLKAPKGALISSVDPEGSAAKAGLAPGDVILKLNGKDVDESNPLPAVVAELAPGTTVTLGIWRDGAAKDVAATIGRLNDDTVASNANGEGAHGHLGLVVRPLTRDEREQSGLNTGLIVSNASGPAAAAGIEPGDVILRVNGSPVRSDAQLRQLVAKAATHVALLIQRDDATIFVPINLG
jgi:serine protease Do